MYYFINVILENIMINLPHAKVDEKGRVRIPKDFLSYCNTQSGLVIFNASERIDGSTGLKLLLIPNIKDNILETIMSIDPTLSLEHNSDLGDILSVRVFSKVVNLNSGQRIHLDKKLYSKELYFTLWYNNNQAYIKLFDEEMLNTLSDKNIPSSILIV